jgi:glycosyltransferase involved in cell wall biosynthesis
VIFPHDVTQDTKRLWLANQAVDYLRKSIPNVRLWVVNGRPPEEMPWYYAAADAMIVTSKREGGPSSVKEALACGVPVVSVPVGDTSLFGEVPFWMVRADETPESLARELERVLNRKTGPRESRLPPELTLSRAARQIETLYREAIHTQ